VSVQPSGDPENYKTVLIADDEPALRMLVRATIDSDQYQVVEATDGEEAWRLVQQHRPIVALLDVNMPGRNGLDVTRAIKSEPSLGNTHVVLLTANALQTDIEAGRAAGADYCITKPFSPLELLTVLESFLEGCKPGE
jgi:CheY-like chemotaxis protein